MRLLVPIGKPSRLKLFNTLYIISFLGGSAFISDRFSLYSSSRRKLGVCGSFCWSAKSTWTEDINSRLSVSSNTEICLSLYRFCNAMSLFEADFYCSSVFILFMVALSCKLCRTLVGVGVRRFGVLIGDGILKTPPLNTGGVLWAELGTPNCKGALKNSWSGDFLIGVIICDFCT